MQLQLDADAQLLRDNVAAFARQELVPGVAAREAAGAYPVAALRAAAGLGLLGMEAPDALGGTELSTVAALAALEALAHADAGVALALALHHGVALTAVRHAVAGEHADGALTATARALAEGTQLAGGVLARIAGPGRGALRQLAREGAALTLTGELRFVVGGADADVLVVPYTDRADPADAGSGPAAPERDIGLALVDAAAARAGGSLLVRSGSGLLGLRSAGAVDIELSSAQGVAAQVLLPPGDPRVAAVFDRALLDVAATALGVARATREAASAYALQREQFGQPIAQFQAIQWKLADMLVRDRAASLLTLTAGAAFASAPAAAATRAAVARAKLTACEAAMESSHHALQVHGGYGYTADFPVERHLRDARACAAAIAGPDALRARLGAHIEARFAGG